MLPATDPAPSPAPARRWLPSAKAVTLGLAATLFYLLVEWSYAPLAEFDAYYHLGMAQLYAEQGIIRQFPWMSVSILRDHFNDPQFLLHLVSLPLVALGVGPVVAGKLTAALTAALLAMTFYWFLVRQQIRYPLAWTLLLLVASPYLLARLTFVKSTALFLALVLVFLDALFRGRRWRLLVLSWLAVLTYQGFPLLLVLALLYLGADTLLTKARFRTDQLLPVVGGIVAGLVVNPFFPNNLHFLHFEIFQQILLKPKELALSAEWAPIDTSRFLGATCLPLLFLFFSELFATSARVGNDARQLLLRALAALLLVGSLLSSRLIDYFVPFALLAAALTVSRSLDGLQDDRLHLRAAWGIALFLCVPAAALNMKEGVRIAGAVSREIDADDYREAAAWLRSNTEEGEVVVTQWDDFPMLFLFNRHNRYLWGLNPAYGFGRDEKIHAVHSLLYEGRIRDPQSFLPQVSSRYLLVARTDSYPQRRLLAEALKASPAFEEVFGKGSLHLFLLLPGAGEQTPQAQATPDSP